MYDSKYSFSDLWSIKKCYALSFTSKPNKLLPFYHRLYEFRNLVPQTEKARIKESECIKMLQIYIIHC